jgi:hypothetical protein
MGWIAVSSSSRRETKSKYAAATNKVRTCVVIAAWRLLEFSDGSKKCLKEVKEGRPQA